MKATPMFLKQAFFSAGIAALIVPSIAAANPAVESSAAPASAQLVAQKRQANYQTFRSPSLGFRISFPSSYTVDRSEEAQGTVRLTRAQPSAQASAQPTELQSGGNKAQSNAGSVLISRFDNPKRLSAAEWAKQNDAQSNFVTGRQSDYRRYEFAGQPAISYSWCASECGDSVVFTSRDGRQIIVLSAIYDYPSDPVRWEFQNIAGKFQFAR